jgi:hypothetical protein
VCSFKAHGMQASSCDATRNMNGRLATRHNSSSIALRRGSKRQFACMSCMFLVCCRTMCVSYTMILTGSR